MLVRGARGLAHIDGEVLTNFCAYDYIGMAHDPVVIAATKEAIDRYGTGAGASGRVNAASSSAPSRSSAAIPSRAMRSICGA